MFKKLQIAIREMTFEEILTQPLDKFFQQNFENRRTSLANMSHAHLSNCYWYSLFFREKFMLEYLHRQLEEIKKEKTKVVKAQNYEKAAQLRDEEKEYLILIDGIKTFPINSNMTICATLLYTRALNERFKGEILPYNPHPNFEQEITWLMQMGMLVSTSTGYDIIYNDVKIGSIKIL